ncbi:MAG: hypothetical protein ACR2RV_15975, partial [Verrucomicrobiales bacterium]
MKLRETIFLVCGIVIGIGAAQLFRKASPNGTVDEVATESGKRSPEPRLSGRIAKKDDPNNPSLGELMEEVMLMEAAADDAELRAYLEENSYSREAVVAAALLSGDIAYLVDAAERYPDDPHVQLLVLDREDFPGGRDGWYARFKRSQPDNMLASMLHGYHLLSQGSTTEGLDQLRTGSRQSNYNDFASESSLAMESALIQLGRSPLEAKIRSVAFPTTLAKQLQVRPDSEFIKAIEATENEDERQELVLVGVALGNQMSQGQAGKNTINRLVGFSMEQRFLMQLDPQLESPALSAPPEEMMEEIQLEANRLRDQTVEFSEHYLDLNEQQMMHYLDRLRSAG